MTDRPTLDQMTSDDLDQLYDRLDQAERLATHLAHDLADIYHQPADTIIDEATNAIDAARQALQEQP